MEPFIYMIYAFLLERKAGTNSGIYTKNESQWLIINLSAQTRTCTAVVNRLLKDKRVDPSANDNEAIRRSYFPVVEAHGFIFF